MNWHERYLYQAGWTRPLRSYLFEKCHVLSARRVLEVGCGTGAILKDLCETSESASRTPSAPEIHGLDISQDALRESQLHGGSVRLTCGDALSLPYQTGSFDITFCHFLLLWVQHPLQALLEMKRVTARPGYVLALAEPDYGARLDLPGGLAGLGRQQNEALQKQGAALRRGAELAELFYRAGIRLVETGPILASDSATGSDQALQSEWEMLEQDLAGTISESEMKRYRSIDMQARARGERKMRVPTYFAWGQV
jgi:SAM-dependent methyltransferase